MSHPLIIKAPLSGLVLPLTSVPDPVFASETLGKGIAIDPIGTSLLAPCDGIIQHLAPTGHAITLQSIDGAEILMHIGIDTVALKGEGFHSLVKAGDTVRLGQTLIQFDLDKVAHLARSMVTAIIVTNSEAFECQALTTGLVQAQESDLLSLLAKADAQTQATTTQGPQLSGHAIVRHASGIHARPAALIQSAAKNFEAKVQIQFAGKTASALSVVGLMSLNIPEDAEVTVLAEGKEASAALIAVVDALQTRTESHAQVPSHHPAAPTQEKEGVVLGICAAQGLAIGQIYHYHTGDIQPPLNGESAAAELKKLEHAIHQIKAALERAIDRAGANQQFSERDIFSAHLALLQDPEILQETDAEMAQGASAGEAFRRAITRQSQALKALGNPLLAERINDLKDLERRVLAQLYPELSTSQGDLPDNAILVTEDLAPSELTSLPRNKVVGVLIEKGGATSHVAILARALGIPTLVAISRQGADRLEQGQTVLLNATAGQVEIHPSQTVLDQARQTLAKQIQAKRDMLKTAQQAAQTQDGQIIEVAANVGNAYDAALAHEQGADAIGLLRTEFLFTDRTDAPTEEEQRDACQSVLDALPNRSVIIRTIDVGGDKEVPYMPLPKEPNPALGLRGIRTGFARPDVLETQLRAILGLQPLARCRIMIPMISSISELLEVKQRLLALCKTLKIETPPELGVMIEVPSAALLADQIAEHVDFMSIGTNDLTQYTLAMDRCHPGLAANLDGLHPAILRLIQMTCEGASKHGKWVGVCGALASDIEAVPVLVGLGVSELSVSPNLIPDIKAKVRSLNLQRCRFEAHKLLSLNSALSVREKTRLLWPHQ